MSFSLIGQDIDEVNGEITILGQSVVSLKLNNETVWTKRAKAGSVTIEHGAVIEETGIAIGANLVANQGGGNFFFTPPADLYTATLNIHGAGGGAGGGEGGASYGGNDGQAGDGGKAGEEKEGVPIDLTPHVAVPMFIPTGGAFGAGAGSGDHQDGESGTKGGTTTFSIVANAIGGNGGNGGGFSSGGTKGEDSTIGTGGFLASGDGQIGGNGGSAAGGGGGSGGDGDSWGEGENGGNGGAGGTGRIKISW